MGPRCVERAVWHRQNTHRNGFTWGGMCESIPGYLFHRTMASRHSVHSTLSCVATSMSSSVIPHACHPELSSATGIYKKGRGRSKKKRTEQNNTREKNTQDNLVVLGGEAYRVVPVFDVLDCPTSPFVPQPSP